MRGSIVVGRIVTKKSVTAKTQTNIGGYTNEKRSPHVDLFSKMSLHVVQVGDLNSGAGPDHAIRPLARGKAKSIHVQAGLETLAIPSKWW